MHTSDLVAQVTSIVVATAGMVIAWLATRHCPVPLTHPTRNSEPGADAERPING